MLTARLHGEWPPRRHRAEPRQGNRGPDPTRSHATTSSGCIGSAVTSERPGSAYRPARAFPFAFLEAPKAGSDLELARRNLANEVKATKLREHSDHGGTRSFAMRHAFNRLNRQR